jgi:hypothetical protein
LQWNLKIRYGRGRIAVASGKVGDLGVGKLISMATPSKAPEGSTRLESRRTSFAKVDIFGPVALALPGEVAAHDSPTVRE